MARCRLYLISPPRLEDVELFADQLSAVFRAGDVACFQLRLKDASREDIARAVERLRPICYEAEVALLLNDLPELAHETGCDGVHIGQEDTPYPDARRIMGDDAIIGVTCHDSSHLAMVAAEQGADYVAFGAFYPTTTKDASGHPDVDLLHWWNQMMVVPSVAIGGITPDNARPLVAAGADFLAVASGVWDWPAGSAAAVGAFNMLFDELATDDD